MGLGFEHSGCRGSCSPVGSIRVKDPVWKMACCTGYQQGWGHSSLASDTSASPAPRPPSPGQFRASPRPNCQHRTLVPSTEGQRRAGGCHCHPALRGQRREQQLRLKPRLPGSARGIEDSGGIEDSARPHPALHLNPAPPRENPDARGYTGSAQGPGLGKLAPPAALAPQWRSPSFSRARQRGGGGTCWKPSRAQGSPPAASGSERGGRCPRNCVHAEDNYLLSGTARGSPGRGSSRARPLRVPRAPSGAASRSANSADAPEVAQRRSRRCISAPPGAAAAAARSRPPSASNAALRRDWRRHSGRRFVSFWAGGRGAGAGGGRQGGGGRGRGG